MSNPRLKITDSFGTRVVPIDKPTVTIGRQSASDVQIHNTEVSKAHAEIVQEHDRYVLRDRGSRFGTFVNGERIHEHVLRRGDRIRLSRPDGVELVFEWGSGSESTLNLSTAGLPDLRQMAAIMDGLRALASGQVLDDVLALVIDSALDAAKVERGFIMLSNQAGELEFKIARRRGRETLSGGFETSVKIPREVFETGKPQLVDDLIAAGTGGNERTVALGIRRIFCVPLRVVTPPERRLEAAHDRIIGVLYLDHSAPGRKHSSAMLESLEAFATQAALAIESARLYAEAAEKSRLERDLRVAADIQRALLAQPAYAGPTCELAAVSIPCRTVGGDFFDYLETADGRLAFALGDVAGKGPPAALLAAVLQSNFAASAALAGDAAGDAAWTTANVNTALLRRPIEARFATMFHGVLTRDGKLTYCNAGHEPPCVLGANGVRWLETGGAVLGLFSGASYESETVQLFRNDVVVICSDGVTEAADIHGQEFGRDRIAEIVSRCRDRNAEAILEDLVGAVRTFSHGAPQADDITLMVLVVSGAGDSAPHLSV